jgi:hypothetical protein
MKSLFKEKRVPPKIYYLKNEETQARDAFNCIVGLQEFKQRIGRMIVH